MFFVRLQSIVENHLEVGGRGRCRVGVRHEYKIGDSFLAKSSESEKTSCTWVGWGERLSDTWLTVGSGPAPGPSGPGPVSLPPSAAKLHHTAY